MKQSSLDKTRRWHVTISCQPDERPPQPVRPWKSGRCPCSDFMDMLWRLINCRIIIIIIIIIISRGQQCSWFRITVFYGVRAGEQKVCEWCPKIWKIQSLFDPPCCLWWTRKKHQQVEDSAAAHGSEREPDAWTSMYDVDTYSQPCPRATGCGHCPGTCHGGLARQRRLRVVVLPSSEWK